MSNKKKIVFFIPDWIMGGAEKLVFDLSKKFSEDGFKIFIFVGSSKKELPIPVGVDFIMGKKKMIKTIILLTSFLKKEKPQLILVNIGNDIAWVVPVFFSIVFSFQTKTKVIFVNHAILDFFPFKKSFFAKLKRNILCFLGRLIYKKIGVFYIFVSFYLRKEIVKKFNIPVSKTSVIFNGIDFEKINKLSIIPPKEYKKEGFKIISVTRLDPPKDIITLLRAFYLLQKKISNSFLFIIGDGSDRDKIKKIINKKIDLRKKIFILGKKSNPYPYIKFADVFVLSSLSEGIPLSILEAIGLGVPVIATDSFPGTIKKEVLKGGKFGIVVPVRNPKKLSEALVKIFYDKNLKKYYNKNSAEITKEFSLDNCYRKYKKIINKFIK